jgi:GAF domain-containing protein
MASMTSRSPAHASHKERRRCQRRTISDWQLLTVEMLLPSSAYGSQQQALMLNVSESGMGVQPFFPLQPEEFVELRFGLPGVAKPLETKAVVTWSGDGGPSGIQFIETASEARDQLRKWVAGDLRLPSQQTAPPLPECSVLSPSTQPREFENGLGQIARRAMVVTRASGVAIALGDRYSMQCRASLGLAPDVGVGLQAERGFSGQCLSTAKVVHCPDAQSDPRIDPALARELQIGSILAAPIFAAGKLAGILEVLSRHRGAFDKYHTSRLEAFASLLGTAIEFTPSVQGALLPANESAAEAAAAEFPSAEDSSNPLACLWTLIEGAIHQGPMQTGFIESAGRQTFRDENISRRQSYWN